MNYVDFTLIFCIDTYCDEIEMQVIGKSHSQNLKKHG